MRPCSIPDLARQEAEQEQATITERNPKKLASGAVLLLDWHAFDDFVRWRSPVGRDTWTRNLGRFTVLVDLDVSVAVAVCLAQSTRAALRVSATQSDHCVARKQLATASCWVFSFPIPPPRPSLPPPFSPSHCLSANQPPGLPCQATPRSSLARSLHTHQRPPAQPHTRVHEDTYSRAHRGTSILTLPCACTRTRTCRRRC